MTGGLLKELARGASTGGPMGACTGSAMGACSAGAGGGGTMGTVKPSGGDRDAGVPGVGTEAPIGLGMVKPGGGDLDASVPSPGAGVTEDTG